jgi:hypothetical protein
MMASQVNSRTDVHWKLQVASKNGAGEALLGNTILLQHDQISESESL